jgi:lipooligosaccharide transport system permease protein
VTPLYHGVELTRGAVLMTLDALEALGHVAVLAAYAGIGYVVCRRTFTTRLEK